jgi:hypothetical protein
MLYVPKPARSLKRHLFRRSDGDRILREKFSRVHGRTLDVTNAKTFTEKLYRRMIETNRSGNPTFTRLADKYLAREHVAKLIGEQHLVPLIWCGRDPHKIPFETLPAVCIAKTNHGSSSVMMLSAPHDPKATAERLQHWLNQNYYWQEREYQYYPIKPLAMIEERLDDGQKDGPLDYRFWCFDGKPVAIQVDDNSHALNAFYTPSWELTGATYRSQKGRREAPRPSNLQEMLLVASALSEPFDFVRIDLYSVHDKLYFGEFTFTPTAGGNKFDPPGWDSYFGEQWIYPLSSSTRAD